MCNFKHGVIMDKTIILILVGILFLQTASAVDIEFTAERNTAVDIIEKCSIGDYPCSDSFSCNATIQNSIQEILVLNQNMTRNNTFYNYTLSPSQTSELGLYKADTFCSDGNYNGTNEIWFMITPSGRDAPTSGESVALLIAVASMFLIAIFFFIISHTFKGDPLAPKGSSLSSGNPATRFFFIALAVIIAIMSILFSTVILMQLFGGFETIIASYSIFLWVILFVIFIIFIFVLLKIIFMALESLRIKQGLQMPREGY